MKSSISVNITHIETIGGETQFPVISRDCFEATDVPAYMADLIRAMLNADDDTLARFKMFWSGE